MAPRDYIIHPSEYDLSTVIADIEEIRRWNQQRFQMEQLTAIVHEDHSRGLCVGYKDVTPDEFWVRGHFPVMPVMPGVMMCEAAAQLSSYYTQKHNLLQASVIGFGGMEDVRFREPVVPGDRLVIAVERVRVRPRAMIVCRFQGIVRDNIVVDGVIKGVPLPVDYLREAAAAKYPMPRRAPKKPPPSVDLSTHLLVLGDLPEPLDPGSLFPAGQPVELEVGSGKGLFLKSASAARPGSNFLGIEIAAGYARMCAGRLAVAEASNARIIHGDAQRLVRSMLPDASLTAIHVYFPDPWWKARHRKRRVLSVPFLEHAGRALVPGGRLHVWTDVEEYFIEAMEAARETGRFGEPEEEAATQAEHDLDYRTHFERRTRLAGQPVWRAVLRRVP